jgi:hypothetical protein
LQKKFFFLPERKMAITVQGVKDYVAKNKVPIGIIVVVAAIMVYMQKTGKAAAPAGGNLRYYYF